MARTHSQGSSLVTSLPPLLPARSFSSWRALQQEPWLLLLEMLALALSAAPQLPAADELVAGARAAFPGANRHKSAYGAEGSLLVATPQALLQGLLEVLLPWAVRGATSWWHAADSSGGGAGSTESRAAAAAAQLLPLLFRCHLLQRLLAGSGPDAQLAAAYGSLPLKADAVTQLADALLQALGLPGLADLLPAADTLAESISQACEQQAAPTDSSAESRKQGTSAGHTSAALGLAGKLAGSAAAIAAASAPPGWHLGLPQRPSFMPLPQQYSELYLHYVGKPCPGCGQELKQPALCLVTGRFVCNWWDGCPGRNPGSTSAAPVTGAHLHCLEHSGGASAFLLLSSSKVSQDAARHASSTCNICTLTGAC